MSRFRLLLGISVFWLGLSMLFDGVNTLVLPEQLLAVAGDNAARATLLGLVSFAGLLVGLPVQPLAGAASDRSRDRRGRRGPLAAGLALTLAALALLSQAGNLALLIVAYVALQAAAAVAQAAQQGFIPDLVPERLRGTASGLKGFMDLSGALLAFAVLGQLLAGGQAGLAVAAIAGVLLVTGLLALVLVREPSGARLGSETVPRRNPFALNLRRHRVFAWAVASRFLFLLGTYAVGRFLLFFVADRLGLDRGQAAERAGALLFALTLITVLASPPAGWAADRLGRRTLMLAGSTLSGLGVLLLIGARSEAQILAFGALMSAGSAAFAGANWAATADLVPREEAARFFGLANAGTVGAAAAAGLLGPLVDWLGYTALFLAAAAAFGLSAIAGSRVRPAAVLPEGERETGTGSSAEGPLEQESGT